jgi:hypothetical protein
MNTTELIALAKEAGLCHDHFDKLIWDVAGKTNLAKFAELLAKRNASAAQVKFTDKEIIDYAIAEEGLLFASEDDYLAIAGIVLEQVNEKLRASLPAEQDAERLAYVLENPMILVEFEGHTGVEFYEDKEAALNAIDAAIANRKDGV